AADVAPGIPIAFRTGNERQIVYLVEHLLILKRIGPGPVVSMIRVFRIGVGPGIFGVFIGGIGKRPVIPGPQLPSEARSERSLVDHVYFCEYISKKPSGKPFIIPAAFLN